MPTKQKYIIYGIGFFLGCLFVTFIFLARYNDNIRQKEHDFQNGYNPKMNLKQMSQFPGAMNPINPHFSLFVRDYPMNGSGVFKRVHILDCFDGQEYWRVEETLWKDPHSERLRLVDRKKMYADQLTIRLNGDNIDLYELGLILMKYNYELLGPGRCENLFTVKIPAHGPDSLMKAIEKLKENNLLIADAVPIYDIG